MSKNQTARIVDRIAARRAELEAQLQALEAETEEHEAHLADRLEKAGRARVALVEDLLDRFEIPQGTPRIDKETGKQKLTKEGKPIFINNDPDETKRMERLAEAIDGLVRRAEGAVAEESVSNKASAVPRATASSHIGFESAVDKAGDDSQEARFTATYHEDDVTS